MTKFEYLSVLISIIIGLGINDVMMSWGRLIRNRRRVRFYWLHGFWSAFVLFLMIQFWWGFWNFRVIEHWSLLNLMIAVLEGMMLVLCAIQLMPSRTSDIDIDLRERYFDSRQPFFILGALTLVQMTITDIFIIGIPVLHSENGVRLAGAGVAALLAWSPNPRLHAVMPAIALVLLGAFLTYAIMV